MRTVGWGVFELAAGFRDRLNRLAPRQYSAERTGNVDRAKRLRSDLVDGNKAIGAGAGRYVFVLPDAAYESGWYDGYVLKLAISNDTIDGSTGRTQNSAEAETWNQTESPLLVPVVAADPEGYWLVMPRGKSVTEYSPELEAWIEEARDQLPESVWKTDIGKKENIVKLEGTYRLCDYGMSN